LYISTIYAAKPKNFLVFAFTSVSRKSCPVFKHFCINLYSADSDEEMKGGDEALNALSLQFLRSIKRFSSPLLFKITFSTSGVGVAGERSLVGQYSCVPHI
jgi:hypothetical protein